MTAASSRPATRPTRSGSGKATSPRSIIETPADGVLGLAYLPSNQQLVSAGSDGLARLWQLPVVAPRRFETKGPVTALRSQPRWHQARHRRGRQGRPDLEPGRRQTDQGDRSSASPSSPSRFRKTPRKSPSASPTSPSRIYRRRRRQGDQENRRARVTGHGAGLSRRWWPARCRRRRQRHPRDQPHRRQDDQGAQGAYRPRFMRWRSRPRMAT